MKRFILMFIIIILATYFVPFAIVSSFTEKKEASIDETSSTSVFVLRTDTKEVVECDLEEYLVGVVSAEMPASYELEALKAQAVAARSYILSREGYKNPDHKGADVCTDPAHCKAYLSQKEAEKKWGTEWSAKYLDKIKTAVLETSGEYISYEGEVAVACFSAVSSGKTENAKDVWGTETPYLKSVDSPEDLTYKEFTQTVEIPLNEGCQKLGISSPVLGKITHTAGGAVKTINIGGKSFSGTEIRSIFGLNSANFEVSTAEDSIVFTTKGKGHGVGMSQYGANEMAKNGEKYTEILHHYYSNVTIEKM